MTARTSLRAMLEAGDQVWAPCVYDCLSARVAEMCGHSALMLSSAELAVSMSGVPDGLLSADELVWAVSRIAASSPLPLVVDAENGGGSPLLTYRLCERLAAAGAKGVTIEDSGPHWFAGYESGEGRLLEARDWAANVRAARAALDGTDVVLIARTNSKGGGTLEKASYMDRSLGIDEAIERCLMGLDAGAEMTLVMDINHAGCEDEVREISRRVPGWKMYPDIKAETGAPDVSLDALAALGFNFVTNHAFMKGATKGMLENGRANFAARSTAYSENDDFGLGHVFHPFEFREWIDRAAEVRAFEAGLKR